MNFNINCNKVIDDYLLNKNPIYNSRGILSILITLIIVAFSKSIRFTNNSYLNQIIIPLCVFFVCMVLFYVIGRLTISRKQRNELRVKCKQWINDPNTSTNPTSRLEDSIILMNLDNISNYNGRINGYHLVNNREQVRERFEIKDINMPNLNKGTNVLKKDKNANINIDNVPVRNNNNNNNVPVPNANLLNRVVYEEINNSQNYNNAHNGECLLGNKCGSLCSGSGVNKCNIVAPVPGPQWQPQSAKFVQNRLE